MEQSSVNQRIKFLVEKLGLSARAFSEIVGESPTNVHNYTGKRNSMPGADFLEKILSHFENVNPIWLITGKGEPFIGEAPVPPVSIANKKNKGPVQNNTGNNTITNNINLDNCKRDLAAATKEVELLRQQLAMAQALLEAKEETLSLLRAGHNRQN
jgi:transcriptional regulator with XRE-family HTH domain